MVGFCCFLLHDLLTGYPGLIELALPIYKNKVRSSYRSARLSSKLQQDELHRGHFDAFWWPIGLLTRLVSDVFSQPSIGIMLCVFVDALDEHEGHHQQLLELIDDLKDLCVDSSSRLKICAASRPENIFEDYFTNEPKLILQEHTKRDIEIYFDRKLKVPLQRCGIKMADAFLSQLRKDILYKAEGVFLWVRLVSEELVHRISAREPPQDLFSVLADIPSDLTALFVRALRRMVETESSSSRRESCGFEAFVIFQLLAGEEEAMVDYYWRDEDQCIRLAQLVRAWGSEGEASVNFDEDSAAGYLIHRSGGLLELFDDEPRFIHETARSFVKGKEVLQLLALYAPRIREIQALDRLACVAWAAVHLLKRIPSEEWVFNETWEAAQLAASSPAFDQAMFVPAFQSSGAWPFSSSTIQDLDFILPFYGEVDYKNILRAVQAPQDHPPLKIREQWFLDTIGSSFDNITFAIFVQLVTYLESLETELLLLSPAQKVHYLHVAMTSCCYTQYQDDANSNDAVHILDLFIRTSVGHVNRALHGRTALDICALRYLEEYSWSYGEVRSPVVTRLLQAGAQPPSKIHGEPSCTWFHNLEIDPELLSARGYVCGHYHIKNSEDDRSSQEDDSVIDSQDCYYPP